MPTPPGFANVSVQLTLAGLTRPAFITFGVDCIDTDPQIIAGKVNTANAAAGSLMSVFDNSVSTPEIRVSVGTDGGEDLVGQLTSVNVGATAKTTLPANCAVLVHKVTTRGGRRGRGRLFIPWIVDETSVDEAGLIAGAMITTLQSAMNTWRTALASNGVPMYLLHDASVPGTAHPTTPGAPNEVTALQVDKLISTQRRRLGR